MNDASSPYEFAYELLQRAHQAFEEARYEAVIPIIRAALPHAPHYAYAYQLLGWTFEELGDLAGVRRAYTSGLQMCPGDADLLCWISARLRVEPETVTWRRQSFVKGSRPLRTTASFG
jgi:Tfp pilus assembly protein PilF